MDLDYIKKLNEFIIKQSKEVHEISPAAQIIILFGSIPIAAALYISAFLLFLIFLVLPFMVIGSLFYKAITHRTRKEERLKLENELQQRTKLLEIERRLKTEKDSQTRQLLLQYKRKLITQLLAPEKEQPYLENDTFPTLDNQDDDQVTLPKMSEDMEVLEKEQIHEEQIF